MHKETVNTFTKGMVKDTHPLTTPADVLTDCLNGTLITYNGNEMILQNDMGNVLIGSAALPEGYVPVGITEYGGIIYVASYNPETKKGQIGSFPSPLLVHQSTIWNVNEPLSAISIDFDSGVFYNGSSDDIIRTEVKKNLGYRLGLEPYIIHTGDKIKIEGVPTNEYLLVQFAILKNDGSLEIIEGNYLDGSEHVYTGKTSGVPMLIIKLKTLKSFNLERTYSRGNPVQNSEGDTVNTVNILFTGKFEEEDPSINSLPILGYNTDDGYTGSGSTHEENNLPMTETYTKEFIPILELGNLVSMKKIVTIDLSKFKNDTYELTNWSYFVTDSYVKINWSFDYYTLDSSKEITKVTFNFKPISNISSTSYSYEIEKESYNGSFEEIINFGDGFTKNNIYLVEIVGNISDHLGNRLIYTSGIFNEYYGKVKDFTNKGFAHDLPEVMWFPGLDSLSNELWNNAYKKDLVINITPTIEVSNDSLTNNIFIESPTGQVTSTSKNNIRGGSFITISDDRGTGYYHISIKNRYNFIVNLTAEVKLDSYIVGTPTNETIQSILGAFAGSALTFTDQSLKFGTLRVLNEFSPILLEFSSSTLGEYHKGDLYNKGFLSYGLVIPDEDSPVEPTEEVECTTGIVIESKILAKASSVKLEEVDRVGLAPLYHKDMDVATKNKAFSAWNVSNPLFACGADENNYQYNVTLAGGTLSGGTSTGAGCDDTGLCTAMELMGSPMVSMAAGVDGDEAEYSPDSLLVDYSNYNENSDFLNPLVVTLHRRNVAGWNCGDNEIDGSDDFLIATWKLTDNRYRFSVLASHRVHKQPGRLNRLDYMIRSLLSLLFTKQAYKYTLKYVTVNPDEYGYYSPIINVEVDLQLNNNVNYNNVTHLIVEGLAGEQTKYDIAINDHMIYSYLELEKYDSSTNPTGIKDDEIMLVRYDIIPEIGDSKKLFTNDSFTDEVGNLLTGATYSGQVLGNDKSNERWIYVPDWTKINASSNIYTIDLDGTINWLLSDMTPYLKLSGTADGSGYVYVDDSGINRISENGDNFGDEDPEYRISLNSNITDPLSTELGSPGSRNISIINNATGPIGDVLRWNNLDWPFYHSFLHMFKTYCEWQDQSIKSDIFNEIVVNRDTDHAGALNTTGKWRHKVDESAPDIFACLGNSYNSIYGRYNDPSTSEIN